MALKQLVFDLGGVIIDVDAQRTVEAFRALSKGGDDLYTFQKQAPFFDAMERGQLSKADFRKALRSNYLLEGSDDDLDLAWNAMLVDIPKHKLDMVQALRVKYHCVVLSNTNAIHVAWVDAFLQHNYGVNSLYHFFDDVHYSHDLGERKPDAAAYTSVLDKHPYTATESLMIDDRPENIIAAQKLGMQGLQVPTFDFDIVQHLPV